MFSMKSEVILGCLSDVFFCNAFPLFLEPFLYSTYISTVPFKCQGHDLGTCLPSVCFYIVFVSKVSSQILTLVVALILSAESYLSCFFTLVIKCSSELAFQITALRSVDF